MLEACWKCKSEKGYVRSTRTEVVYCRSCGSVADYSGLTVPEMSGVRRAADGSVEEADDRGRGGQGGAGADSN